jgi:hypothetical protein
MNDRQKIEERLRKKEQELQGLEEKLRAGRVYVQALRDILKMLDQANEPAEAAEAALRPGSAVAKARDIISQRGHPVHVNELLKALGKEVTRVSRASLTSSLAAYVRRGEIFTRPAPNTFGLSELGHVTPDEEANQPPQDFGRITSTRAVRLDEDEIPF